MSPPYSCHSEAPSEPGITEQSIHLFFTHVLSPAAHRGVSFGLLTPTPTQVGLVGGNLPQKSGQPAERNASSEQP